MPYDNPIARAVDWLFGYDFFISYNHGDGMDLPRMLKQRLEEANFRVFLDQSDYVAGMDLRRETRRQVLKSRKIVVICRAGALASVWVKKEVDVAVNAGKVPILIDINAALAAAPADAALATMARANDWLRLEENLPAPDSAPSDKIVAELVRGFDHTRQETKRQRVFAIAAVVLGLLSVAATLQAIEASRQRALAVRNFETAKEAANGLVIDIARDLRNVEGMRADSVRKILGRAEGAFNKLAASAPRDPTLLGGKAGMYVEVVTTYLDMGLTDDALKASAEGVTVSTQWRAVEPRSVDAKRAHALALLKRGDAHAEVAQYAEARAAYASGLKLREEISAATPDNDNYRRDISVALVRLGQQAKRESRLPEAQAYFERALAAREELGKRNKKWRRDIIVARVTLNEVLAAQSKNAESAAILAPAIAIARAMVAEDGANAEASRDLAICLQYQGDDFLALKDWAQAEAAYTESQTIFERLAQIDPTKTELRRDVAVAMAKLGDLKTAMGDQASAHAVHGKVVNERRAIAASSPDNFLFQADLAEALKLYGFSGPPAEAGAALREARGIYTALAKLAPLSDDQNKMAKEIDQRLAGAL